MIHKVKVVKSLNLISYKVDLENITLVKIEIQNLIQNQLRILNIKNKSQIKYSNKNKKSN